MLLMLVCTSYAVMWFLQIVSFFFSSFFCSLCKDVISPFFMFSSIIMGDPDEPQICWEQSVVWVWWCWEKCYQYVTRTNYFPSVTRTNFFPKSPVCFATWKHCCIINYISTQTFVCVVCLTGNCFKIFMSITFFMDKSIV